MTTLDQLLQKTDRCIDFANARNRILKTAPAVKPEIVPLEQASQRILAGPVVAQRDCPPAAVSAMDGFALRHADLDGGPLKLQGYTAAGEPVGTALAPRAAQRVFTGALIPPEADTVLIQEDARASGDEIFPTNRPNFGAFVRPKAFDFSAGTVLIEPGEFLTPSALALSAAANLTSLTVAKRPRIALIATGSELCDPGMAQHPQDVVASNSLTLAALLQAAGAQITDLGYVKDQLSSVSERLEQGANYDLLITTGGASVGNFDLVQAALHSINAQPNFWQVLVRPGKPVFLWDYQGTPVLGLPGNPVSAYVCARVFALPWLRRALGASPVIETVTPYPLAQPLPPNGQRHQFARADLIEGQVYPAKSQDSSLLRPLHSAGVLIERPPQDPRRKIGNKVSCILI